MSSALAPARAGSLIRQRAAGAGPRLRRVAARHRGVGDNQRGLAAQGADPDPQGPDREAPHLSRSGSRGARGKPISRPPSRPADVGGESWPLGAAGMGDRGL